MKKKICLYTINGKRIPTWRRVRSFGKIRIRILICGVPFGQIHFQFSNLSNPLWRRIHRITDLNDLKTDHWISAPAHSFGKRIRNQSLCTAVFALREGSTSYMGCFFLAFPAFTRTAIVVVSGPNLAIFLPVLSVIHQKIDQMPVNYDKSKALVQKLSVLPLNYQISF